MEMTEFDTHAKEVLQILKKGAFLTTAFADKVNTMTIGWGGLCYAWRSPVFMAMVRRNRFTHELLEASGEFTVTLPQTDLQKELAFCGVNSGRDTDKFSACGLELMDAKKTATPLIKCPALQFECKVLFKTDLPDGKMDAALQQAWYGKTPKDEHTLYFGEILASYIS